MTVGVMASLGDSDITITPVKDSILLNQSATYDVSVYNKDVTIKDIRIYTPDVEWIIPDSMIHAYPQKETVQRLTLTPTKYVSPKTYGITLNFKVLDTEELIKKMIYVNVMPPGQAVSNYLPSLTLDAIIDKQLEPGKKVLLVVIVENQNVLVYNDLKLRIKSDLDVLNTEKDIQLNLSSLERKTLELNYAISQLEKPGTYKLNYELIRGSQVLAQGAPIELKVLERTPPYQEDVKVENNFLKTVRKITYTSQSNVDDTKQEKVEAGLFKRLFTETSVKSKIVEENGIKYLAYDIALSPGESKTVTITTDYRILLYILIIVIIGWLLYIKYRSPIGIVKSVSGVKLEEGGISRLKVMLEIKNISHKEIKNVTVTDYIPNIADISKEFIEGTIKPSKVFMHQKKGTIVKWDLPEIAPGEDRLISYDFKSRLSILGNFRLPRAKAIFDRNGRAIYSYSNTAGVNA
jgi:hypothetical protein